MFLTEDMNIPFFASQINSVAVRCFLNWNQEIEKISCLVILTHQILENREESRILFIKNCNGQTSQIKKTAKIKTFKPLHLYREMNNKSNAMVCSIYLKYNGISQFNFCYFFYMLSEFFLLFRVWPWLLICKSWLEVKKFITILQAHIWLSNLTSIDTISLFCAVFEIFWRSHEMVEFVLGVFGKGFNFVILSGNQLTIHVYYNFCTTVQLWSEYFSQQFE